MVYSNFVNLIIIPPSGSEVNSPKSYLQKIYIKDFQNGKLNLKLH